MKVCSTIDMRGNWVIANEKSTFWAERLPTDEVRDATEDEILYFTESGYPHFNFSEWSRFWDEKKNAPQDTKEAVENIA